MKHMANTAVERDATPASRLRAPHFHVRPHSQSGCRLPRSKKFNTPEEMPLTHQNYVHKLTASWADMDFNAHMANTAMRSASQT